MERLQLIHLEAVKEGELFYEKSFSCTKDVYEFARQADKNPDREKVYLLGVDSSYTPVFLELLAIGGINSCPVDIRNIFKSLLLANCTSFFLWHNHTSLAPLKSSMDDRKVTKKLYKAGKLMGIKLEDHLIINGTGYYSILGEMLEGGEMD